MDPVLTEDQTTKSKDFLNRWNLYLVNVKSPFPETFCFTAALISSFLLPFCYSLRECDIVQGLLDNYDGWVEPARDMYRIAWESRADWISSFLRKKNTLSFSLQVKEKEQALRRPSIITKVKSDMTIFLRKNVCTASPLITDR